MNHFDRQTENKSALFIGYEIIIHTLKSAGNQIVNILLRNIILRESYFSNYKVMRVSNVWSKSNEMNITIEINNQYECPTLLLKLFLNRASTLLVYHLFQF